jgi:DNA polymerase III sliding clamp (beta) subunit (PCNA family)
MTFSPWDGELGVKEFSFYMDGSKLGIGATIYNQNGNTNKAKLVLETQKPSAFISEVFPQEPNLILNSNVIKSAIEKSLYAIDTSSLQDFVRGLRIFVEDGVLKFTSTNGSVISDYTITNEGTLKDGEYFLSHDFISGLRRLAVDDSQWFFELSRTKNILSFENIIYWAKSSMYKEYPRYQEVFKHFNKTIELDRYTILSGLSSMEDAWNSDDHNRLTLELKDSRFFLQTDTALFECPDMVETDDFSVDVDGKDLLNTFRAMSDAYITLKLSEETRGIIAESKGFEDHQAYLVCLTRR